MIKKIILIIFIIIILGGLFVVLTGCSSKTNNNLLTSSEKNEIINATSKNEITNSTSKNDTNKERDVDKVDYKNAAQKQMSIPKKGDTIAILHIKNYGDVKVKFFEEIAPKATRNFITHAKEGYYDGLTFHRVINEFMIQGGDPEGTGFGGESIWGEGFGTELDYELVPYRGSLCMAMSQLPNSIGSQFFITQAKYNEQWINYLKQAGYPEGLIEEYKQYGGYLSLYLQYTVFGQVFEGIEIIDKIATVETDENDKPIQDVIIEKIEVTTFDK
ncbi:MAG: peptidylprolyl isomerase [Clostridia bacterium]|nr:peptidylprolyl isomerase [Clostridia bacterium]